MITWDTFEIRAYPADAMPDRRITLDNALSVVMRTQEAETSNALVPFLLVHGLASNARVWDGVAAELAQRGHPVAAVDLRGHGRSGRPDDGYDMATVADDVALVIAALGWERPAVAGQSWGGNVVIELAYRHPGVVGLVVVVDGGFIDLRRQFPRWEDCARALAPPRLAGARRADIERWLREAHPDWPETGIEGTLANFETYEDGTVAPWLTYDRHLLALRGLWEHDVSSRFPDIDAPVLLLPADTGPSDDPATEWATDKEAAVAAALAALPRASVHWFRPADHDVHAQHPAEVAALMHAAADRANQSR
jgi:pimeloyl-ACP methyl ester carboxylesterase